MTVKIRKPFNVVDVKGLDCSDSPTRTKQEFLDECDINMVLDKYKLCGSVPTTDKLPLYDDVSEFVDYRQALDIINKADSDFMSLDAKVRNRFNNSPLELLKFVSNSDNYDEAVSLGLCSAKVKVVPPVSTPEVVAVPTDEKL